MQEFNDEMEMWNNPQLVELNKGKFCLRRCERVVQPTSDTTANWYCPACDRVLKFLKKKEKNGKK
jgi:hypothetical protein